MWYCPNYFRSFQTESASGPMFLVPSCLLLCLKRTDLPENSPRKGRFQSEQFLESPQEHYGWHSVAVRLQSQGCGTVLSVATHTWTGNAGMEWDCGVCHRVRITLTVCGGIAATPTKLSEGSKVEKRDLAICFIWNKPYSHWHFIGAFWEGKLQILSIFILNLNIAEFDVWPKNK